MTIKDKVELLHTGVAIIAIVLGGWWAWRAFIRRRLKFPRVCVKHVVTHRRFGTSRFLVHVSLIIENRGEVLLRVHSMIFRLQQVLPEPPDVLRALEAGENPVLDGEHEVRWPLLAERKIHPNRGDVEIEPGEIEHVEFDFFIPDDVRTIEVYSHIQNDSKRGRDIGWPETTLYDLVEASHTGSQ